MRLKKLHIVGSFLTAGIAITTLSSNSGGITGRSTVGCGGSGCHGTAANGATVIGLTGLPASGWVAGTTYAMTLTVANATSTITKAGFDLNVNIGTLTNGATGTMIMGTEMHHTTPKTLTSGATSWTFSWTAPASRTTALTVNIVCNAVNGNGGADAADQWNTTSVTSSAAVIASIATLNEGGFSIYPNPAKDQLMVNGKAGVNVSVAATSLNGSALTLSYKKIGATQYQVDIAALPAGMYVLVISSEGKSYASRFVKQ